MIKIHDDRRKKTRTHGKSSIKIRGEESNICYSRHDRVPKPAKQRRRQLTHTVDSRALDIETKLLIDTYVQEDK